MFSTDTENIQQLQSDILLEQLDSNPYFKKSPIASKNKALLTTSKYIVGAINEVQKSNSNIEVTTTTVLGQLYDVIGDTISDTELLAKLKAIGDNLILALCAVNAKAENELLKVRNYSQVIDVSDVTNTFVLQYQPCSNILFFVNGILYINGRNYTYDSETNTITWTFDADNNGFNIENSVVNIIYDYIRDKDDNLDE